MEAYQAPGREEELVRKAVEQSRLMEGEDSASSEPNDVMHWVNVYSELVAFKSRMLAEMTASLPGMAEEAASEVGEVDIALVERQQGRYKERLRFWKERARVLAGIEPQQPSAGR